MTSTRVVSATDLEKRAGLAASLYVPLPQLGEGTVLPADPS